MYELEIKMFVCLKNVCTFLNFIPFMDSMHSDHTRGCVVAGVLHNVWLKLSLQGNIIHKLVATQFSQNHDLYMYSICLVSL